MCVRCIVMGAGLGLVVGLLAPGIARGEDDWRMEVLQREGYSGETDELKTLVDGYLAAEEGLQDALQDLASEDFKTRERAQASIMMAGNAALAWMRALPPQDDPEVRVRLREIAEQLRFRGPGSRDELLRDAVQSLLAERKSGEKDDAARLVFVEWFEQNAAELGKRYGRFEFQADRGMEGVVKDGRLRFPGGRRGDGDQFVMLTADAVGMKVFPEAFRVSCVMGGDSDKGAGAWHVGVSVGQVRVLYHPGMAGGSFRMETTGGKSRVRRDTTMGFNPDADSLERMEIGVRVLKSGDVELAVVVASGDGGHVFQDKTVVDQDVIGAVDRIGLWRSGRTGADALFDDFVLDLRGR